MKMWSQRRIAPVALASLTLATGCFNLDGITPEVEWLETATAGEATDTDPSAGTSPISTVTSDTDASTSGDPSSGSGSAGTSEGSGATSSDTEATGDRVDEAPTIELLVDESASVPTVVQATTLVLSAHVADDQKVAKVEFFVDGALLDVVDVNKETATVAVDLPIYDDGFNEPSPHVLHAIVHDDAEQTAISEAINFKVELPVGGSKVWEAGKDHPFASKAYGVTTDSVGDVIVVGWQAASNDPEDTRILVRKHACDDGALLWEKVIPGEAGSEARGVAVDAFDNIYVVGRQVSGGVGNLWIGKFTDDSVLVTAVTGEQPHSIGHGVVVDEAGWVYVAGYYTKADLKPFGTLQALDPNLKPHWSDQALSKIGTYGNNIYGIALDNFGNIVVAGALFVTKQESRGLIALYSPTGGQTWWRSSVEVTQPNEWAYNVAVTPENEFVCVGRRQDDKEARHLWSWRVSSSGNEQQASVDVEARCGGPELDSDEFCGVAVAPSGHEILSGVEHKGPNDDDFMVKKMTPKSKKKVWTATLDGYDTAVDRSLAVTTDVDGFVIAVGYEHSGGKPQFWAAKYNP